MNVSHLVTRSRIVPASLGRGWRCILLQTCLYPGELFHTAFMMSRVCFPMSRMAATRLPTAQALRPFGASGVVARHSTHRYASSTRDTSPNAEPSASTTRSTQDGPSSNGEANPKRSRLYRFSRFALISGSVIWAGVELDKRYNSAAITRSIRTGWMG